MEHAHIVTPVVSETADGQEVIHDFVVDGMSAFDFADIEQDPAYIEMFGEVEEAEEDALSPQENSLLDWARENLPSEHVEYILDQLDDASPELWEAHMEELALIKAELQDEEAENDPNENVILDEERETFDAIITDLSGTEPGGSMVADEFLSAASKAGDNDLYAEMMMGAALFHQGKGQPQQIAERLISKFGKHEVYAIYEQLTNNG